MARLAYTAAALALFFLGVVYGREAGQALDPHCGFAQQVRGRVVAIHKIESERAAYVLRAENSCLILVTAARFPLYAVGEYLDLTGDVQLIQDFPPEIAGYGAYLARKGVSGTMRYPTSVRLEDEVRRGGAGPRLRETLRDRVVRLFPEPEASAVLAMVLGQAGTLPADTIEDFRRVGVSHILAISGMNLSLLTAAILALSLLLPIRVFLRIGVVLGLMWLYVWLIVFPVSAVRAAWFWTFAMAGLTLHLLVGLPTVFALAVASMVTLDPQIILDIGFQLSVSAVAGMWLAAFLAPRFAKEKKWLPRPLRLALLASIGATLTTWPIVAYHFGIVSIISLLANILIVPPVSAFMVLSLLATVASSLPLLALSLSFGVRLLWQWMTGVASVLATWPHAALTDVSLPFWFLPVYYLALAALAIFIVRWQKRSWREAWQ